MPSSSPESIAVVVDVAWQLAPRSVLDIGAGYGKYGVLFREYLELKHRDGGVGTAEHHVHERAARQVRIDALEGFGSYIGDVHRAVYDNIYIENLVTFLDKQWSYDFIYMGDVLEHIQKEVAAATVLPTLVARANQGVLVSVPAVVEDQSPLFGNALEIHRSTWSAKDFVKSAPYARVGRKGKHLIAFLSKESNVCGRLSGRPIRRRLSRVLRGFSDAW